MKIVVRFRDGEQDIPFDSRLATSDIAPKALLGHIALAFMGVVDAYQEDKVVDAWIELDNGERLFFSHVK